MAKKIWVSRDAEGSDGNSDAIMVTSQKPIMDSGTDCPHCGLAVGTMYRAPSRGFSLGADGDLCYNGWLRVTGFKLEPGQVKQVEISVKEVK